MSIDSDRASAGAGAKLRVRWVQDEAEFAGLRDDWNALADSIRPDAVFLRHEWFDAAWQWRKRDAVLALACVRRGENLLGIAPLIRTRRRRHGLNVRCLEFLTVPDTQFCDVLAAADERAAVFAALVGALASVRPRWDLLHLTRLATDALAREWLPPRLRASGLACGVEANDVNLYIDLAQGWQTFYASRSRRLKKANNLVANRLQRAFETIDIECIERTEQAPNAVAAVGDAVVALSAQSWKKRTGLSLDQPGPGAFFRRLVEHAHSTHWLSIWLLRLDRAAAAMELQIAYRGNVHALRADFAETFKTHSPGTYLNWKLLESIFGGGRVRYWFGPGENSYKLHWTDVGETLYVLRAYNRTVRGRWLALYETTLRPWLKRILRRGDSRTAPKTQSPPT